MPSWLTWERVLEVGRFLAGIATAAGLLFAIVQTRQAKQHARALADMHESLTTRYMGPFPDFCGDIVTMLERAKHSIVIMCDFPGYAAFTDPETFLRYRQAIERKLAIKDFRVEITCYDSERRRQFFDEGFSGGRTWEVWRAAERNDAMLRNYLRHERRDNEAGTLTQAQLADMLEEADGRILRDYFRGAQVREMSAHLPVYFWMIDKREAIFVFSVRSEEAFEHGFTTTDAKLIKALEDLRERYHRESVERAAVKAA